MFVKSMKLRLLPAMLLFTIASIGAKGQDTLTLKGNNQSYNIYCLSRVQHLFGKLYNGLEKKTLPAYSDSRLKARIRPDSVLKIGASTTSVMVLTDPMDPMSLKDSTLFQPITPEQFSSIRFITTGTVPGAQFDGVEVNVFQSWGGSSPWLYLRTIDLWKAVGQEDSLFLRLFLKSGNELTQPNLHAFADLLETTLEQKVLQGIMDGKVPAYKGPDAGSRIMPLELNQLLRSPNQGPTPGMTVNPMGHDTTQANFGFVILPKAGTGAIAFNISGYLIYHRIYLGGMFPIDAPMAFVKWIDLAKVLTKGELDFNRYLAQNLMMQKLAPEMYQYNLPPSQSNNLQLMNQQQVNQSNQTMTIPTQKSLADSVFTNPQIGASYPGGPPALSSFFSQNIQYNDPRINNCRGGEVVLGLTIDATGRLKDVKWISKLPSEVCNTEALRVLGKMPNWMPAQHFGQNVSSYFPLTIRF